MEATMDELGVALNAAFDPKDVAEAVQQARGSVRKRTTIEEARNALQGGPYIDPINRFEIQIYDGTEALNSGLAEMVEAGWHLHSWFIRDSTNQPVVVYRHPVK
jgi:hypothetical protein